MGRPWRLEEFTPRLPQPIPPKKHKDTYFCEKCWRWHYIYSDIGNDHKDFRDFGISPTS